MYTCGPGCPQYQCRQRVKAGTITGRCMREATLGLASAALPGEPMGVRFPMRSEGRGDAAAGAVAGQTDVLAPTFVAGRDGHLAVRAVTGQTDGPRRPRVGGGGYARAGSVAD